jgi:hypothetical protein
MARMTERQRQHRIDAIREHISIAAAGISFGAALWIVMPDGILSFAGIERAQPTLAATVCFVAALVWLFARASIHGRWK